MRHKPIPAPPDDLAAVDAARRAIPLVPVSAEDCAARLLARTGDRLGLRSHEAAGEWLAFLRALGLVERTDGRLRRPRDGPGRDELAAAFRERVYGARELLDALDAADGPLDADAAFERLREPVPAWERHRRPDPEAHWRERTRRLCGWATLLGLAERVDGGYRPR